MVSIQRLDRILGYPAKELDYQRVDALVSARQREDLVLEFKGMLPARNENKRNADRLEVAKDVAAMANASGGLILYGVHDVEECASKLEPLSNMDRHGRWITAAVAEFISPIPAVDVDLLQNPDEPGSGVIAVWVEPSNNRPHCVTVADDTVKWPIREGTITRYMREPEIARSYSDRLNWMSIHRSRIDEVFDEGILGRNLRILGTWLAVAAVPVNPAPSRRSTAAFRDQSDQWLKHAISKAPPAQLLNTGTFVGLARQRVVVSENHHIGPSSDFRFEFHSDGSGFGLVKLESRHSNVEKTNTSTIGTALWCAEIEMHLIDILYYLQEWADELGAFGGLDLRASILTSVGAGGEQDNLATPYLVERPPVISPTQFRRVPQSVRVPKPHPVEFSLPEATGGQRQIVESAHAIASELFAEFGVDHTELTTENGGIKIDSRDGTSSAYHRWVSSQAVYMGNTS